MNQQRKRTKNIRENEVGELKITYATDLKGDPAEIAKEKWRLPGYEIVEGNKLRKPQEADKFLK